MSNVTILQTKDLVFIGADSAVSTSVDDQIYRLHESGQKLWIVDDKIIFCAGKMKLASAIMKAFKKSSNRDILTLQQIVKEQYALFEPCNHIITEVVVSYMVEDQPRVFKISEVDNFEIVELPLEAIIAVASGGIRHEEARDIATRCVIKESPITEAEQIRSIYQHVFDSIAFEGVGGVLTVYMLDKNGITLFYQGQINEPPLKRMSSYAPYVNERCIYTGILSAQQVNAVNIDAGSIKTGKLNAELIDTQNLSATRIYQLNSPNNFVELGGSYGDFILHYNGNPYFTIYNALDGTHFMDNLHGQGSFLHVGASGVWPTGKWDFSSAEVKLPDSVKVTAVFG